MIGVVDALSLASSNGFRKSTVWFQARRVLVRIFCQVDGPAGFWADLLPFGHMLGIFQPPLPLLSAMRVLVGADERAANGFRFGMFQPLCCAATRSNDEGARVRRE